MDLLHASVQREGAAVVIALRNGRSRATVLCHPRAAAAIGVLVRAAGDADEDCEFEISVRGQLDADATEKDTA